MQKNEEQEKIFTMKLTVIGAHPGDVEYVSGALIHKYVASGHHVQTIILTNADHGHPSLAPEIYGKQTREECQKASEILQTELLFFERSSGTVQVTPVRVDELAQILKKSNPDCIITHGPESFHRDHIMTNALVRHTLYMHPDLSHIPFFYPENWEDNRSFCPEYYVPLAGEDIEVWEKACLCFECFREGFYKFDYHKYYKQLFSLRGAEARVGFASCFMRGIPERGKNITEMLPI